MIRLHKLTTNHMARFWQLKIILWGSTVVSEYKKIEVDQEQTGSTIKKDLHLQNQQLHE